MKIFTSKSTWRSELLRFKLTWISILVLQVFIVQTITQRAVAQSSFEQPTSTQVCPLRNSFPRRSFETSKYKVYICLGDTKNPLGYYVRVTKSDDIKITLPITRKNGETYIAFQGEISHIVSPYEFMINKLGRILNRERVLNAVTADGKLLASACPQGENVLIEAVTRSFIVYICGNSKPGSYVGVTRQGNEKITLPLQELKPGAVQTQEYVAVNGKTRFLLTRDNLEIAEGDLVIIKEKVLRWQ